MISILSIIFLVLTISTVSIEGLAVATNCGSANDAIRLSSFRLVPDPIKVPGSGGVNIVAFNIDAQVSQDLVHPIKTDITLKTKVFLFWVTVPCTDNVGSCSYPAWCELCKTCQCPIQTGFHAMSMSLNITSAIPKGDYEARIVFTSASGQKGCVDIKSILLN